MNLNTMMAIPRENIAITGITTAPAAAPVPALPEPTRTAETRSTTRTEFCDQLHAIMLQQSHYRPCSNYLEQSSPSGTMEDAACHKAMAGDTDAGSDSASTGSNAQANECWRRKICEWSYEVADHFGFEREAVSIALNYLDRAVAIKAREIDGPVPRRDFQLIAVASLYLALKLHGETDDVDGPRRRLRLQAFVELSRGLFSAETIERMETELLGMLQWRVNPPTTVRTVATMLRLLPRWRAHRTSNSNAANSIFEFSKYLTELSVCVSDFTFRFDSSTVAFASILCAMNALRDSTVIPHDVITEYLDTIASVTSLTPSCPHVQDAQHMLMGLCPSMFEMNGLLHVFEHEARMDDSTPHGHHQSTQQSRPAPAVRCRTSPVSVVEQMQNDLATRKRCRPTAEY